MDNAKRIAQLEGYLASEELAAGLRSGDPLVREQAYKTRELVLGELALLRNPSYNHGLGTGKAYGDGFRASSQYVMAQIGRVVTQANAYLRAQSPPSDPRNPLHRIDEWGERTGHAWAEGFAGGIKMDGVGKSLQGVASGLTGLAPAMAGAGGGPTVVVNIGDFHGTTDNIEELNRRLGETVRAATLRRN